MRKYRLTDETINYNGITLHRIEALKDIGFEKREIEAGGFNPKTISLKMI